MRQVVSGLGSDVVGEAAMWVCAGGAQKGLAWVVAPSGESSLELSLVDVLHPFHVPVSVHTACVLREAGSCWNVRVWTDGESPWSRRPGRGAAWPLWSLCPPRGRQGPHLRTAPAQRGHQHQEQPGPAWARGRWAPAQVKLHVAARFHRPARTVPPSPS